MTDKALATVNMHMHTHFSFNAEGLSPAQLVERAAADGIYAVGICDFDVLDGLDEFYQAADAAPIRACTGMETRVFFSEYGDQDINSPGEPGVYYFMGMGFGRVPDADTSAGKTLAELRRRSGERNRALIDRIKAALPNLAIDYEADVLPLVPVDNATERHIVRAYIAKVRDAAGGDAAKIRETWANALGLSGEKLDAAMGDDVALQNAVRSGLIKAGGVGYVKPDSSTFPLLDDVIPMILDAGAIPMATWLNGLSEGESDMATQLECLRAKGVAALNIVPDRNWNISDPDERDAKVRELHDVVRVAESMQFPINVGTELNSFGQAFVDDFAAEPMRPLHDAFLRGATIMVGQARLARFAGFSYCGPEAEAEFAVDVAKKNVFFQAVGALDCPDAATLGQLKEMDNEKAYAAIRDSAKQEKWATA